MGNRIRLKADDPFNALRHELCHGWDYVQGWTSMDQGDLFAEYLPSPEYYPTKGQRAREAFAMACEEGIPDLSVDLAFAEACGTEAPDTTARDFLRDEVYPYDETPLREVEFLEMLGEPWGLEEALEGWWIREVVGTDQALVLLAVGYAPHHRSLRYRVVQLDPLGRAVLSTTDLPLRDFSDLTLAGGDEVAGLLVHHVERPTQGFRLPVDGGLERQSLPELLAWQSEAAFVVDESVWLLDSYFSPNDGSGVIRADWTGGEVELDPLGQAGNAWSSYASQIQTVDGPVLNYIDASGDAVQFDPRSELTTAFERDAYGYLAMDEAGFLYADWATVGPVQAVHRVEERERFELEACDWQRTRQDWLVYAQGQLWFVEGSDGVTGEAARLRRVGS